ncbi:MAG: 23S rRNA (guanosine(2251)-2'-O)-methyltransferase RlmB [Parvibaculales bacterium]
MKKRKHSNVTSREKKPFPGAPRRGSRNGAAADKLIIYGLHAAKEALKNPNRQCLELKATKNALRELEKELAKHRHESLPRQETTPDKLSQMFKPGTVHQGVALTVAPLPETGFDDLVAGGQTLIVLDQVTDPRNIGAIMRAAAVFGAGGIIVTRRNAPAPAGALAKTASGALEHVPLVSVANLSRCLSQLQDSGYVTLGLDERGDELMAETDTSRPVALVMGAEGQGLRRLTKESCTRLVRLPNVAMQDGADFACLNVATATAVSLYELAR